MEVGVIVGVAVSGISVDVAVGVAEDVGVGVYVGVFVGVDVKVEVGRMGMLVRVDSGSCSCFSSPILTSLRQMLHWSVSLSRGTYPIEASL